MSDNLNAATERLSQALAALEAKTRDVRARAAMGDDDLFAGDVASGDDELRAAAVQASEALGRAADALRDVMGEEV